MIPKHLVVRLLCLSLAGLAVSGFGRGHFAANPAHAQDAARRTVSGTLQRSWSDRRQRHEYYVVDAQDGVRYYISTERDLSDYLGRRVSLSGRPKPRVGQGESGEPDEALGGGSPSQPPRSNPEPELLDREPQPLTFEQRLDEQVQRHQVRAQPTAMAVASGQSVAGDRSVPGGRSVRSAQHVEEVYLAPSDPVVVEGEAPLGADQRPAMVGVPSPYESSYTPPTSSLYGDMPLIDGSNPLGISPLAGAACEHCGQSSPGSGAPCPCGTPHRVWVRGEYLLWMTKGMYVPPLVTTSPQSTPQAAAGVLGQSGTSILFGDERILTDNRSGVRLQLGTWLDCCQYWGVEGELFGLADMSTQYVGTSDGVPILARPFQNALTGLQDSELVAYPNVLAGSVVVDAETSLYGLGLRGRWNLAASGGERPDVRSGHSCYHGWRVDALGGYRFLRLSEDLAIQENVSSRLSPIPVSFQIRDQFETRNDFHGGDLGLLLEWQRCRWTLEVLGKAAIGNTRQQVTIRGNTQTTTGGTTTEFNGGLLAQRTNSGTFTHDTFTVVPEIGVHIGYQLTRRLRATLGYSLIYWNHVARPGDQIDTTLNPNLLPPEANPFSGPLRPAFVLNESDFWAQGLDFGLRYVW